MMCNHTLKICGENPNGVTIQTLPILHVTMRYFYLGIQYVGVNFLVVGIVFSRFM